MATNNTNTYTDKNQLLGQIGNKFGEGATAQIRGDGATKQAEKLNLGHTVVAPAPAQVAPVAQAPVAQQASSETIVEKKVYVDVDSVEEKNIIAEAFAKMALLIMENKRLRAKLATRQGQLRQY